MKLKKIHTIFWLCMALSLSGSIWGQDKKHRVRLKADFVKIMNAYSYLDLKANARVDKQTIPVAGIELVVYHVDKDSKRELGRVNTNSKGLTKFNLGKLSGFTPDSSATHSFQISFDGNQDFRRASKTVAVKEADIKAKLITLDSIPMIEAVLVEKLKDSALAETNMQVQVQRLFNPLPIGEEFNFTDSKGRIRTPIDTTLPGINGVLYVEVVLQDHELYGTVKSIVEAPVGVHVVPNGDFDERTLWSPRNKTPVYIILFTLFLIVVTWGLILYLINNLYRIAKS